MPQPIVDEDGNPGATGQKPAAEAARPSLVCVVSNSNLEDAMRVRVYVGSVCAVAAGTIDGGAAGCMRLGALYCRRA